MQNSVRGFVDIILPHTSSVMPLKLASGTDSTQPRVFVDVNVTNKQKALINYTIEAGHSLKDLSTGLFHNTDGPNTFELDTMNHP